MTLALMCHGVMQLPGRTAFRRGEKTQSVGARDAAPEAQLVKYLHSPNS